MSALSAKTQEREKITHKHAKAHTHTKNQKSQS